MSFTDIYPTLDEHWGIIPRDKMTTEQGGRFYFIHKGKTPPISHHHHPISLTLKPNSLVLVKSLSASPPPQMKLLNLFAFLPLFTGFFLPGGTPDGAYLISRNQDRSQNTTKIDVPSHSPTIEARRPSGPLTKRNSHGRTGRTFPDYDDYNFLTNTWRTYLQGGGIVPGLQVLVMGRVQARLAGCNYRSEFHRGHTAWARSND